MDLSDWSQNASWNSGSCKQQSGHDGIEADATAIGVMRQCALAPKAAAREPARRSHVATTLPMQIGDGARHCASPAFRDEQVSGPICGSGPLLATSASLDLVELLVVASVGQDYPDLADAGKAQIDAARPTTRPA